MIKGWGSVERERGDLRGFCGDRGRDEEGLGRSDSFGEGVKRIDKRNVEFSFCFI